MSGLGPSFVKIWTCGRYPRSGSRNAWTRIKKVNSASRLSKFWKFFDAIQLIFCRDWWPWTKPGYITMTRRQSNNHWNGGITNSKFIERKNSLEKFSPRFFGITTVSPSLIIFQRAKQRGVLLIPAGAIEGHFEGKTSRGGKVTKGVLVLTRQCPGSTGTCNSEETGLPGLAVSWSPILFSKSGPVGLPLVPWTEKKQFKISSFFVRRGGHCCRGDQVGRTTF